MNIKLFRSKTIWYAIIVAVLSVLQGYIQFIPLTPFLQAVIGCAVSVGIVVLRFMTTTPLMEK